MNQFRGHVSAAITSVLIVASGLRAEAQTSRTPSPAAEQAELLGGVFGIRSIPLAACEGVRIQGALQPTVAPQPFTIGRQAGQFTIFAFKGEEQAVIDVGRALLEHAPQVCRELGLAFHDPVTVELHSNQASLDRQIADPGSRGHYAHSEGRRIRMITPRQPIKNLDLPYPTRVQIAVHEFAHIVNGAINPQMPLWLNEGTAVFAAPHAPYAYVCRNRFPREGIPALRQLQESYDSVRAGDLFAFTVVDFIVAEFGRETLHRVIRAPDCNAAVRRLHPDFEHRWRTFMEQHYGTPSVGHVLKP